MNLTYNLHPVQCNIVQDLELSFDLGKSKLAKCLQDVYSEVARLVKQSAKLDAVNGSEIAQKLLPYFDRSLVKQTVMTSVYGVTMLGEIDHLLDALASCEFFQRVLRIMP